MRMKSTKLVQMNLLREKKELIESVINNLKKEETLLISGDSYHALKWEDENSKVLNKLFEIDKKLTQDWKESLPLSESDILLNNEIYEKMEIAREIQVRVEAMLKRETEIARQELNEISIKRQLKFQLNRGLNWNMNI